MNLYETEFPGMYVTEDGYLVDEDANLYDEDGNLIEENALVLNEMNWGKIADKLAKRGEISLAKGRVLDTPFTKKMRDKHIIKGLNDKYVEGRIRAHQNLMLKRKMHKGINDKDYSKLFTVSRKNTGLKNAKKVSNYTLDMVRKGENGHRGDIVTKIGQNHLTDNIKTPYGKTVHRKGWSFYNGDATFSSPKSSLSVYDPNKKSGFSNLLYDT